MQFGEYVMLFGTSCLCLKIPSDNSLKFHMLYDVNVFIFWMKYKVVTFDLILHYMEMFVDFH